MKYIKIETIVVFRDDVPYNVNATKEQWEEGLKNLLLEENIEYAMGLSVEIKEVSGIKFKEEE